MRCPYCYAKLDAPGFAFAMSHRTVKCSWCKKPVERATALYR